DHTMVRQGLRGLIEEESDMQVVGEAQDGLQAIALTGELAPEVVLMDINMPRMDGIEATRRIKAANPKVRVIGLSMHVDAGVMNSMRAAGVSDYVTKDTVADVLCNVIREQVKNKSVDG
ncbi:MAG: response regulator transcription factor, partial [Burkholderiales bacterium]|nr:response regulator transcription factor [Burkholderiales bacterium]